MAHGRVDVLADGVTSRKHVPVGELHRLGALRAQLAGNHDLAALRAGLHHITENAVARAAHGQPAQQLVAQRLGLRDRAQAARVDLFRIKLDRAVGKAEALLDGGGQLADAAPLDAEDVLGARGADDDLGAHGRDADLDARVALRVSVFFCLRKRERERRGEGDEFATAEMNSPRSSSTFFVSLSLAFSVFPARSLPLSATAYLLGQLAGEELVELGVEDAVGDELFCCFYFFRVE